MDMQVGRTRSLRVAATLRSASTMLLYSAYRQASLDTTYTDRRRPTPRNIKRLISSQKNSRATVDARYQRNDQKVTAITTENRMVVPNTTASAAVCKGRERGMG